MQTDDLTTIRRQLSAMRMQAQALLEQADLALQLVSEASTPELPDQPATQAAEGKTA